MGNWLHGIALFSVFFIMVGPVLQVLEVKLKTRAWLILKSECWNGFRLTNIRTQPSTCWVLGRGADVLAQAGITVVDSWVGSKLTKTRFFRKDKQRSPRIVSSFHMSPKVNTASLWRYFETICHVSNFLEIPRRMNLWDSDNWHVPNPQTPLTDTHCV